MHDRRAPSDQHSDDIELVGIGAILGHLRGIDLQLGDLGKALRRAERHNRELKGAIMTTKDELLTELADVRATVAETGKDVKRVIARLDEAVTNGNLDDVAAAVAELKTAVAGIDADAETAAPEPVQEPTPGDGGVPAGDGSAPFDPNA